MDPEEIEFLAEKQKVSIVPTFSNNIIHLISGDIGPFRAGLPLNVPLWIAINLKQQQRCRILKPDWMDIDNLEQIKEEEKSSSLFTKMPSDHYMIEAKLLLAAAADDIPRADDIKTMIKDIWDIRMSKLRSSIDKVIKGAVNYAALDHLTILEINSMRPIVPHALDKLYSMKINRGSTSQSQNTTFNTSFTRFSITNPSMSSS